MRKECNLRIRIILVLPCSLADLRMLIGDEAHRLRRDNRIEPGRQRKLINLTGLN